MTTKESDAFEHWLNIKKENGERFRSFSAIWELTGKYESSYTPDIDKGWEKVKSRTLTKNAGKSQRIMPYLKIAAGILLLVSLATAIFFISRSGSRFDKTYFASESLKEVILPDGSTVWLNKNSTLLTPEEFNGKNREVKIIGEGYFDIARDTMRPFIIECYQSKVEVLGTSFNIRAFPESGKTSVMVKTGRVKFMVSKRKSTEYILTAGDKVVFDVEEGEVYKSETSTQNYLAWKEGWLKFNNNTIGEVCSDLEHFYGYSFTIDENLKDDMALSGNFKTDSLEEILNIIETTLDINFRKTDSATYLVTAE